MASNADPAIGILALQGDVALHTKAVQKLGVEPVLVRQPNQLDGLKGLIIPGGESTALLKLAKAAKLLTAIKNFAASGGSIFGTCAGAIIIAKKVTNPAQASLGLVDITIERNGYGRQLDSREAQGQARPPLGNKTIPLVFIRAPKICRTGKGVTVLAVYRGEPVLVEQGRILAATFHPELTDDPAVYEYWLNKLIDVAR